MRDMSQLTIGLFECDCPLLQLFDQAGDAFIVNLAGTALRRTIFSAMKVYGSLVVEANKLLVGLTQFVRITSI